MTQSSMCIPLWPARNADATHLVMCPFAGGSSSAFRHWREQQLVNCALSLVTWPGRDRLRHLAPVNSITQLAARLADELEATISPDAPLLLAGHSMGAQVAFETCRLLEQRGRKPQGLIISGCHAPHLRSERQLSHRDDADFIAELTDIGGCSAELRENKALMSLFLPLLRADFYATERYHYDSPDVCPPLHTPALLLYGSRDREASRQQVDAWRLWLAHVAGPVVIDGDHFYPTQQSWLFFTQIVRHFPHLFSAMTDWQKQPGTSER
ncbi:thioesterase [Salmonella enterica subsp. enterica serovar Virchow]|nr:thioesterase [Salmonella enterica subsp. enterica serovar Virchow]